MPSQTPTDVSRNVPKKFPTDSYAATDPQGTSHPEPAYAAQPNQSSKPSRQHTTGLERLLHGLFLLLVMLAVLGIFVWFDIRLHKDVVSRQPIGQFQRMSGPGGLLGDVVIETETGSYLLRGTPAISKGTPLVLEVRASGYRCISDVPRTLCIETTHKEFKSPVPTQSVSNTSAGKTP
jgi:hypothetical protein